MAARAWQEEYGKDEQQLARVSRPHGAFTWPRADDRRAFPNTVPHGSDEQRADRKQRDGQRGEVGPVQSAVPEIIVDNHEHCDEQEKIANEQEMK
jgi:hypothetical protein